MNSNANAIQICRIIVAQGVLGTASLIQGITYIVLTVGRSSSEIGDTLATSAAGVPFNGVFTIISSLTGIAVCIRRTSRRVSEFLEDSLVFSYGLFK